MEINEIVNTVLLLNITKYLSQFACSLESLEISYFNDCNSNKVVISLFIYRKVDNGVPQVLTLGMDT